MGKYRIVVESRIKSTYRISDIDKIFGMNKDDIRVNTDILAAKEVIYTKRNTGGRLSILQVKKRLFGQMKSEEYWSFLANETDLF